MTENKNIKKTVEGDKSGGQVSALTDIYRTVPKLCTSVQIGVLDNGNVVLSMVYAEEGAQQTAILLDRFIIDRAHAMQLSKVLGEAVDVIPKSP